MWKTSWIFQPTSKDKWKETGVTITRTTKGPINFVANLRVKEGGRRKCSVDSQALQPTVISWGRRQRLAYHSIAWTALPKVVQTVFTTSDIRETWSTTEAIGTSVKAQTAVSNGRLGTQPNRTQAGAKPVLTLGVLLSANSAQGNKRSQSVWRGLTKQHKICSNDRCYRSLYPSVCRWYAVLIAISAPKTPIKARQNDATKCGLRSLMTRSGMLCRAITVLRKT